MTLDIDARLIELGLTLPTPGAPAGNFVPCVQSGHTLYVSGQVPRQDGKLAHVGKVGREVSLDQAKAAAQLCALAVLSLVKGQLGSLNKVRRICMVQGFVNAVPEFDDHPVVINGASDLLVQLFGERGRHARFAVGAGSLPGNVAVEVAAILEVD
ncbi:MAG: RidA family protein [Burkholderiales bacterium]|nr:RidA family protein [Burkholderiales bacterium]